MHEYTMTSSLPPCADVGHRSMDEILKRKPTQACPFALL